MESRKNKKELRHMKYYKDTGLSFGVANMDAKPLDSGGNKFFDFLIQVFLFFLGGFILCGLLLVILTIN